MYCMYTRSCSPYISIVILFLSALASGLTVTSIEVLMHSFVAGLKFSKSNGFLIFYKFLLLWRHSNFYSNSLNLLLPARPPARPPACLSLGPPLWDAFLFRTKYPSCVRISAIILVRSSNIWAFRYSVHSDELIHYMYLFICTPITSSYGEVLYKIQWLFTRIRKLLFIYQNLIIVFMIIDARALSIDSFLLLLLCLCLVSPLLLGIRLMISSFGCLGIDLRILSSFY